MNRDNTQQKTHKQLTDNNLIENKSINKADAAEPTPAEAQHAPSATLVAN
jgi:hypothetical protein